MDTCSHNKVCLTYVLIKLLLFILVDNNDETICRVIGGVLGAVGVVLIVCGIWKR